MNRARSCASLDSISTSAIIVHFLRVAACAWCINCSIRSPKPPFDHCCDADILANMLSICGFESVRLGHSRIGAASSFVMKAERVPTRQGTFAVVVHAIIGSAHIPKCAGCLEVQGHPRGRLCGGRLVTSATRL